MAMGWLKNFFSSSTGYSTPDNERVRAIHDGEWRPPLASADGHVLPARGSVEARIGELIRQDGFMSGVFEHHCTLLVGPKGLQLNYTPDGEALGWSKEQTRKFAKDIERRFKAFTSDSRNLMDATGKSNWVQLQTLAARSWLLHGEILGVPKFIQDRGPDGPMGSSILLIDPNRLATPHNAGRDSDIRSGVEIDRSGRPIAYYIHPQNPLDRLNIRGANNPVRVEPYSKSGRRKVIHLFDSVQPGQNRGISLLAAAVMTAKRQGDLSDSMLRTAIAQASQAITISSSMNYADAMALIDSGGETGEVGGGYGAAVGQVLSAKGSYYGDRQVRFGQATATHLLPGEELQLHQARGINEAYESFAKTLNREAAKGSGGLSLEQFTGDYSQTSYSASQMALGVEQGHQEGRRNRVISQFTQACFELWLEELFIEDPSMLPADISFYNYRAALCNSTWTGGLRVHPDPVKAMKAAEMRIENRLTSRREECERLGVDYDEMIEQQLVETEEMAMLPDPKVNRSAVVEMPDSDEQEAA